MSIISSELLLGAAGAAGGYEIERSLRFNSDNSSYLERTPSSNSNRQTFTLSWWIKRCEIKSSNKRVFAYTSGTNQFSVMFDSNGAFYTYFNLTSPSDVSTFTTRDVFRDPSAWYHFVMAFDTTQATETDRVKMWVNGVQITQFQNADYPRLNSLFYWNSTVPLKIGGYSSFYIDDYLAEIHSIDGQALDPTSFGVFDDNGVWQPKAYSGSYGTNGFYLDFSDYSTAASLGTDASGNGNDWTVYNLSNPTSITWSSTYPLVSSTPYDAFDGNLGKGCKLQSGGSLTVNFTPGISVTSNIELYTESSTYISGARINGGTTVNNPNSVTNWWTLSFSGTMTSLEVFTTGTGGSQVWFGTNVDGLFYNIFPTSSQPSVLDSPTNGTQIDNGAGGEVSGNYATLSSVDFKLNAGSIFDFLADGNLTKTNVANTYGKVRATMPVLFGGKTYFEVTCGGSPDSNDLMGFEPSDSPLTTGPGFSDALGFRGNGNLDPNSFSYSAAWQNGDVLGFYFDYPNQEVGYYLNGVDQGVAYSSFDTTKKYVLAILDWSNAVTGIFAVNFGQYPFVYSNPGTNRPSADFKVLCTAHLDDPTIADGSTAMDAVLYSGNSSSQSISGYEFSPDLIWIKARNNGNSHAWFDIIRGTNSYISSSSVNAEATPTGFASFDSNGFSFNAGWSLTNESGYTYVGWCWDGGSSTDTNTDGDITSTVRANPSVGFSVVKWTSPPWAGSANRQVGHGLNAAPHFIITKGLDQTASWYCYHRYLDTVNPNDYYMTLNTNNARGTLTDSWGPIIPDSTTFGDRLIGWGENEEAIAYCWAPVEGYSAFGSYTGNGSTDGPFVFTGFRPRWVMINRYSSGGSWMILDSERNQYNLANNKLAANSSAEENNNSVVGSGDANSLDFLSNGFKLRSTNGETNGNGVGCLYAAFAENPFKTARAR